MNQPRDNEPINFTRAAAARIANAVRKVEVGERAGGGLQFEAIAPVDTKKTFRVCTFTGAWSKNASKVVTFRNQTSTPNTASATNLFADIAAPATTANCAIAREGTAWFLIAAECV